MTKVNIPTPCHEDWNKMTPTAQGAFCGKCQIDVIDFSEKSNSEIKAILIENRGKHLCAHIKTSQLQQLNADYYNWENQSVNTFQSKFLWACMLVFGMTLFTGCNPTPEEPFEVGMMEFVDQNLDSSADKPANPNTGEYTLSTELRGRITCDYDDFLIDGLMDIYEDYYDSIAE